MELGGDEMRLKKKNHDKNHMRKHNNIDKKRKINKKYLKNGSYSASMVVIFSFIIIVINMIIEEIPSKYTQFDVSEEQIYSIGNETVELLNDLEKEVTIYQVVQSNYEDEMITNLLGKYEDESEKLTVVQKDPVINPKFVQEYTDENLSQNSLIVECGERFKIIDYSSMYESSFDYYSYSTSVTGFDGEGQITSAIAYVTSENLPKLYVLEGHGELELNTTLKEDIEKGNIEIVALNLLTVEEIPETAKCLMINSPTSDISEEEKEKILKYLQNGGKAIIFSDYMEELPNFDELLENYGVQRAEGLLIEENSQYYAMQTPYYLLPEIADTEITEEVVNTGYYVLAPYAQGIIRLENVRENIEITGLLTTSDAAYSKINTDSNTLEKSSEDIDGPFEIGVYITEEIDENSTTEILYFTTTTLQDTTVNQMVSGGNEKLLMGGINMLLSSEENTSISIPSKSLEISYLSINAYDVSFWSVCTIILIPGAFLLIGIVIWLRRRRA